MDVEMVARVRRFNRTVTQRVGALQDDYLSRERPLGQARVLWEIGDGSDVRALRSRLELDSGYLSRILRSLESDGLVVVAPPRGRRPGPYRPADRCRAGRARAARRPLRRTRGTTSSRPLDRPATAGARSSPRWPRWSGCWSPPRSASRSCPPRHPHARCLPAGVLRRAGAALRDRLRPRPQHPGDRRRTDAPGRPAPGRDAARGAGGMWRAEVPRRRAGRDQADVGGADGTRNGPGRAAARRARTAGRRARGADRAAGDQPDAHRGDRDVPARGYREVPAFNDEPYAHHWFEKQLG